MSTNIMQALHTIGLNPFAVTLLAESVLKSPIAPMTVGKPQRIAFPVKRSDCAGWAGVRITIEAVPESAADQEWPVDALAPVAPSAPADTEPLTWHLTTAPKRPDADEQCLLWIRYPDGAVDWEAGFLDGDGWRLCESGGLVDGEVLAWAQPGGPRA